MAISNAGKVLNMNVIEINKERYKLKHNRFKTRTTHSRTVVLHAIKRIETMKILLANK